MWNPYVAATKGLDLSGGSKTAPKMDLEDASNDELEEIVHHGMGQLFDWFEEKVLGIMDFSCCDGGTDHDDADNGADRDNWSAISPPPADEQQGNLTPSIHASNKNKKPLISHSSTLSDAQSIESCYDEARDDEEITARHSIETACSSESRDRPTKTPPPFSIAHVPTVTPPSKGKNGSTSSSGEGEKVMGNVSPLNFLPITEARKDTREYSDPKSTPTLVPAETITEEDVIGGRSSTGMNAAGTRTLQKVILDRLSIYQSYGSNHGLKSKLTQSVLNDIIKGRFIKKLKGNKYVLMTKEQAKKKVSQAWRDADRKSKKKKVVKRSLFVE